MLIKRNVDISKNAYPNWQKSFNKFDEYFVIYSRQFKKSADKLIDSIGENHDHIADDIINPAFFLYRHSIELFLKGILHKIYLDDGMDIQKIKEKLLGHELDSIWTKVFNNITEKYTYFNNANSRNELKKVGKVIMEVHMKDKNSMVFRYPFDTELIEFVYGDGQISYGIDFINLKEEMDYIHSRLEYWIYEHI